MPIAPLLSYIDDSFYVLLAAPVILATILVWLQAWLDRNWISHEHVLNKFNHFVCCLAMFAGGLLAVRVLVFELPLAGFIASSLGIWTCILAAAPFCVLFILNLAWPEQKYLNAFMVWLLCIPAWGYYWLVWRV